LKLNFNGLLKEIQRNADDMTLDEVTSSKRMSLGELQVQVQQLKQEVEDAEIQLWEQVTENEELHDELDEMEHQLEVERRTSQRKSERQKSERTRLAKLSRKRGMEQRRQALADMEGKVEELESRALAAEKGLKKS
jgi:regulator of replication initiation timing